ncbi:hypothetical protein ACU4GD_10045 [Cupriavidus basilensis]
MTYTVFWAMPAEYINRPGGSRRHCADQHDRPVRRLLGPGPSSGGPRPRPAACILACWSWR